MENPLKSLGSTGDELILNWLFNNVNPYPLSEVIEIYLTSNSEKRGGNQREELVLMVVLKMCNAESYTYFLSKLIT